MLECHSLQKKVRTISNNASLSFIHLTNFSTYFFLMPPTSYYWYFFFQSYEMRHKISQYCFDQLYLTAKRISEKMARFIASNMWKINPRALPSSLFAKNDFFRRFLRQILKVVYYMLRFSVRLFIIQSISHIFEWYHPTSSCTWDFFSFCIKRLFLPSLLIIARLNAAFFFHKLVCNFRFWTWHVAINTFA